MHARLSPSAAHRWLNCTASVRAIERAVEAGVVPADESNDAADEGTAAHQVRAECLELGLDAHSFVGTSVHVNGKDWPVTEEMATALQRGIDWIVERAGEGMFVEVRVKLDPWLPGQFGTVDCAFLWTAADGVIELVIVDLKYGFGAVDADDNEQQMLYAAGVLTAMCGADTATWPERVLIVIDQPRQGGLKPWTITKADLLAWLDMFAAPRAAEALGDNGVFRPSSSTCEWCPLRAPGLCSHRTEWILSLAGFDDDDAPPVLGDITPERRAFLRRHAGDVIAWLGALQADAYRDAMSGRPDPGWKLVLGPLGDRAWPAANVAAATALIESALGDDAYVKKVLSPAQAEKVMKPGRKRPGFPDEWKTLTALWDRAPATPMLVPAEDPRPEYRPVNPDEMMDDD